MTGVSIGQGRKLGSRTLRLGARGADVRCLQEFLGLQGYDLGAEEHYGYLTEDAVRQFQREHGLVADGIAGPRFFALILQRDLPLRRRAHLVQPGETLEDIAQLYGVGLPAFAHSSRLKQIYPGQRLVFFDREIWGIYESAAYNPVLDGLTGLIAPWEIDYPGSLPCVCRTGLGTENGLLAVHNLLRTRGRRKDTARKMLKEGADYRGLYLSWKEVALTDGRRYLSFLKRLKKALQPEQMLFVELGPGVPSWKLWGGLDYFKANELADRVVLSIPVPDQPEQILNRLKTEQLLGSLSAQVYSWKILLNIPVFAVQWEISPQGVEWIKLPYSTALSRAFRYGARLQGDEQGDLFYSFGRRKSRFQLRLPQYNVFGEVLSLVNSYNLAGVLLDSLGMEDPRLWGILTSYFRAAQL